jgi:hypothetical protein
MVMRSASAWDGWWRVQQPLITGTVAPSASAVSDSHVFSRAMITSLLRET